MLRFDFTDIDDNKVVVNNPLSMSINIEENVPADDMVVTFACFAVKELKSVVVYDDDAVVFTGVVDEQQILSNEKGEFVKIVCRSMAAMLLDNESVPVSYYQPSSEVIALRHIRPYGLTLKDSENVTYFSNQTVHKGDSNYRAVEDFSKNMFSSTPRINAHGEVEFKSEIKDPVCVFSNNGDGIAYVDFCESIKRCEEISCVRIKLTNSCGYNSVVENDDAIKRGVVRERCINSLYTQTPAECAKNMIVNGREKSYNITLKCPKRHLELFMRKACVKDRKCTFSSNLYVSSLRYQLDNNTDMTTVVLKRKEE